MKRFALCAPVLLLAVAAGAQTWQEYRSNAIGMRLGVADGGEAGDFALRVLSAGNTEETVLLEQGREVRRTLRVTDPGSGAVTETVSENGAVAAKRSYDARMRLIEEQTAAERRTCSYRGELLESLEVSGPDGQLLYRERYAYTSRGRLREADRSYADGSRMLSSFLFVEGLLVAERLQAPPGVLTARYDASGRLVAESERSGGDLVWDRRHTYDPASGLRIATVEARKDHTVRRTYDSAGRVTEEDRTGAGPYRSVFAYDGEGRQTRLRRVGTLGTEEWLTEYDGQGEVARESYLARGSLQKVRVHTGKQEWHDDLYRDGRAVLRVFYRNNQKTGEERLP